MAQQGSASYGHLLVLRGYDDEATLALIFGRIGSRLSSIVIDHVSRVTWWTTPFLGFSGLVLLLAFRGSQASGWVLTGALVLYSMLGFICQLASATVGRELLRGALQLNVAVNSVPSFGGTTSVPPTIYPENEVGLRHTLYNNERCIRHISDWISIRYSQNSQGSFESGQPKKAAPDGAPR